MSARLQRSGGGGSTSRCHAWCSAQAGAPAPKPLLPPPPLCPRSYGTRNPNATTRPIAVLRQPVAHVTRMLPPQRSWSDGGRGYGGGARPEALSAINYLSFCFARLSPFIPVYRGTPGDALPSSLVAAGPSPDPVSLCWRARRLQAIVFQAREGAAQRCGSAGGPAAPLEW